MPTIHFIFEFSPYHFSDRLLFVAAALILNLLIGGPPSLHRALGFVSLGNFLRRLLRNLDTKLNRETRSDRERAFRGLIVLTVMIVLAGMVASSLSALTAIHKYAFGAEILLLALFLPQRLVYGRGYEVLRLLKARNLDDAQKKAKEFSLRETYNLDAQALSRTSIEYVATAWINRVLSPIFWYILLGLPGFIASKIITEASFLSGYESSRHRAYGFAAQRMEGLFNIIPAIYGNLLFWFSCFFVPNLNPFRALKTFFKDRGKISPPQKSGAIALAAGALGISLGGPRSVQGYLVKDGWVGSGTAKASLKDLRKILLLYAIACLLNLALVATLLFLQTQRPA